MSRVCTAVLCLLMICCTFTGCMTNPNQSSVSDGESSMTNDIIMIPSSLPENLTITIPEGFQATSSAAYREYYIMNDASIIITDDPIVISGERLEQYVTQVKEIYEETADQYALIGEETIEVGGIKAQVMEISYAIVGQDKQQDMQAMIGVLLHDDIAYVVTCKSLAQNYLLYRGAFRACIESIVIESPSESTETTVLS